METGKYTHTCINFNLNPMHAACRSSLYCSMASDEKLGMGLVQRVSSIPQCLTPSLPLSLPPSYPQSLCGVPSTCSQQHDPANCRTDGVGNRGRGGPPCRDSGRLPACSSRFHPPCLHIRRAAHRYIVQTFMQLISRNSYEGDSYVRGSFIVFVLAIFAGLVLFTRLIYTCHICRADSTLAMFSSKRLRIFL